jgi:hypothetical protein
MANQHSGVEIEEIDANELEGDSDVDYEEEEAYTEEEEEELEDGQIEEGVFLTFLMDICTLRLRRPRADVVIDGNHGGSRLRKLSSRLSVN